MIIDRAARFAGEDRSNAPRLARALLTAVVSDAVSERSIANAVVKARTRVAPHRPAVVATAHGNVAVRGLHPSIVQVDLPCDMDAGVVFRARAAPGGAALVDAVDQVESGNLSVPALRGALAALAEWWPRDLFRTDGSSLGTVAAAARPFLHSARCDGLGAGLEGPVVSLRLLSEPDDRPLKWSTSALGAGPGRKIPPDPAAFAAPFIEMFADPVFRARFEAAVHDVFMDPDAAVDFAFGGTEFSVSSEGESLVLASFIDRARISDRAPWMVQRQVADPRVALRERMSLARAGHNYERLAATDQCIAQAARAAGIGAFTKIEVWHGGHTEMQMHFKLPA